MPTKNLCWGGIEDEYVSGFLLPVNIVVGCVLKYLRNSGGGGA